MMGYDGSRYLEVCSEYLFSCESQPIKRAEWPDNIMTIFQKSKGSPRGEFYQGRSKGKWDPNVVIIRSDKIQYGICIPSKDWAYRYLLLKSMELLSIKAHIVDQETPM